MSKAENIEEVTRCAQALFASRGYDNISLREISQMAQIGLGTINFYFGSKEGLFKEVVERMVRKVNEHRLALLGSKPQGRTPLEHVMYALIWPIVSRAASDDPAERNVPRMIRWAHTGPAVVEQGLRNEFDSISDRLLSAICDAAPGLSRQDAIWVYSIVVASLYSRQVLDDRYAHLMPEKHPHGKARAEEQTARLVKFAVAGVSGLIAPG